MSEIVELEPGDARLEAAAEVMLELRPHLDASEVLVRFSRQHAGGYRLAGVFDGERCLALAGYRILESMVSGRFAYVDDLVTTEGDRSSGHGSALLDHVAGRARAAGCESLELDSGVHRPDAHRFYFREGMTIRSFHFQRPLA